MEMDQRSKLLVLCFLVFFPATLLAQPPTRSGYEVAWFDEFDSTSLDTSLWTPADTNVTTNNSLQDYLPEQVTVAGGNLVITSQNVSSRFRPYRSGLVTSTALQKHGRWDVRAKLPTSTGMWPAIWMLSDAPWPSEGEIDIMENRGDQPNLTSSAFHYGTNPPFEHNFRLNEQTTVSNSANVNYHDSFHKYSVEWDPSQVRYYVDDVHHWTVRDSDVDGFLTSAAGPMRLILNTAVGGDFLDNPDVSTQWPQTFEIDYVHAYSKSATDPVLTFENGGFEEQGGSLAHWTTFGKANFNNIATVNDQVGPGEEVLKLFGQFNGSQNFSGIEQGVSVSQGDELFASADAFIASNDSIFGSSNQVELKIDYYSEAYGLFGTGEYLGTDSIVLADGLSLENTWLNGQLSSVFAPAGAVEARLAIVFQQLNNSGGSALIDNVSFGVVSAVPEPSSIAVLGLTGMLMTTRRRRWRAT